MNVCINTNDDKIITGYAVVGSIEGGEMINADEIPDDICKGYYKLINSKISLDEELKSKIVESS